MHRIYVILLVGLFAGTVGCHSPSFNAKVFHPWCWNDAREFKAHLDGFKHILMVCIYEDHWEDQGPNRYSLYHAKGTVVRVYKGDWHVSERISLVEGLDYPVPTNPPSAAGSLWFVFTREHTNAEICSDPGEFTGYDAEYLPALEFIFSK
jgi:hypothetical protein